MKTNTDYFYHYNILGLQPGASKKEVQTAFRSLAKLYHADQDSSPYAEMRYKEIRAAYDALRQKAKHQPQTPPAAPDYSTTPPKDYASANSNTTRDYRTVCGKGWYYTNGNEDNDFEFSDLVWHVVKPPPERLPFSMENLPGILEASFKEVFGIGMAIRIFFMALGFWLMLTWVGWGVIWRAGTILSVLLSALLYRYYFSYHWYSHKIPVPNIAGSLLLSVVLAYLCATTTWQTHAYVILNSRTTAEVFPHLIMRTYILLYLLWGHAYILSILLILLSPMLLQI